MYRVKQKDLKQQTFLLTCIASGLLFITQIAQAAPPIVVNGNQIITKPVVYKNVTLDLSHGEFTINQGGAIDIENSIINVTISPSNPFFVSLTTGDLTLKHNTINVTVNGITPNSDNPALYHLIQVQNGTLTTTTNSFLIDTPYTVSLLSTQGNDTEGFNINGNTIKNFHGGLYLLNSNNVEMDSNIFQNVSSYNIYNSGNMNNIRYNLFSFPGNLKKGDAVDIVNSDNIIVSGNVIETSANYGVYVTSSQNIFIEKNKITDGFSYGIYIETASPQMINKNQYLLKLLPKTKNRFSPNSNVQIINNYIEQNRYGLAGGVVDQLTVKENIFIQKFSDNTTRQYWTNNDILLPAATNVNWTGNFYKEAFTQEVPGDNTLAYAFVTFPAHGGVSLP